MEGVGRNEILNWINDLLQLDYKKIEQMGSGAAVCQIIDVIHPGRINLKMVNFNAKYDYEFVKNFSYLQESFAKIGIEKYVEVSELVKSRPQANLEFCQWLKKYFDQFYNGEPYNALERRQQLKILTDRDRVLLKGKTGTSGATSSKPAASKPTPSVKPAATTATKPSATTAAATTKPATSKPTPLVKPAATTTTKPVATATTSTSTSSTTTTKPTTVKPTTPIKSVPSTPAKTTTVKPTISQTSTFKPSTVPSKPVSPTPAAPSNELQKELDSYKAQVEDLNQKIQELSDNIKEIESDRDFYFDRLRAAEIYCQENPNDQALKMVLAILYSTNQQTEDIVQGEEQEEEQANQEALSEPEPEPEPDNDIINATDNLAISDEENINNIEDDQQLEEQIEEEIIQEEEQLEDDDTAGGMNEEEIMNRLQEEGNDELLDSTFDEGNELIADEQEEF